MCTTSLQPSIHSGIKQQPSQQPNRQTAPAATQVNVPLTYCVDVTIWCWQNWHVHATGTSRNWLTATTATGWLCNEQKKKQSRHNTAGNCNRKRNEKIINKKKKLPAHHHDDRLSLHHHRLALLLDHHRLALHHHRLALLLIHHGLLCLHHRLRGVARILRLCAYAIRQ